MTKGMKAYQMYGKSHPSFKNFFTPYCQKMMDFLREYSELNLQIERFAILYSNKVVYDETDKDSSIAFRLFRDGIRSITFYEGIDENELSLFLEVISQPAKDQDIALNMWECDFAHITFYVVEEDEEFMTYKVPDAPAGDIDYDEYAAAIMTKEKIDLAAPLDPMLTDRELEELKQEISEEESPSQMPIAITILIDFLNTEKSQEIIDSLTGLLELCTNNQDFYNARRIVHKLQNYPEFKPLEKFENEATIMGFSSLPDLLCDSAFNEFVAFIGFFSKRTVRYFVRLMTGVKRKERLEALRQRIAYICQDDIAPLVDFLIGENTTAIINATAVLGIMKVKDSVRYLDPLANHVDPSVRIALAQAYSDLGQMKKVSAQLKDLDQVVRIKTLQLLTVNKYPKIYPELLRRIKSKEFRLLDFSEQKEYIACLVANDDRKVIKYLEKMLFKRKLFGAKSYRDMRRLAAIGLAQIGSDETYKILDNGIRRKNKDIKMACELVLKAK